jgi:hypothetical protein
MERVLDYLDNSAMDRGMISIVGGRVVIAPATGTDGCGTVWMTKHQIADLFGCFVAKVVSNIAAVLKSGVLNERRVCRLHRYKDGGGIELYSLEIITALAFRIDTRNADIFRRWLMERVARPVPQSRLPIAIFVPVRENRLSN